MKKKRTPRSPIFQKGNDHTFAEIGLDRGRQHVYAESFLYGADLLVKHVTESNHDQNLLVYSIALLYRHHIELELKNIINTGGSLVDEERDLVTHNLQVLWGWAKPIIRVAEPSDDPPEFAELNKLVSQFSLFDAPGDAFRYDKHLGGARTLESIEYINIGELSDTIRRLGRFLGGCWEVVNQHVEYENGSEWS